MAGKADSKLGKAVMLLGGLLIVGGAITFFRTINFDAYLIAIVGIMVLAIGRILQRGFVVHFYVFGFYPILFNPFGFSEKTIRPFVFISMLQMIGAVLFIGYSFFSEDFKFALLNLVG